MPIGVFLVLYLGLGIVFEYVMKIPMGFYNIPIVLAFMVAILVACFQNREVSFDDKLSIMAQGLADKNIITMLLIFLVAGSFVGVVGRSSAESVAYFMLSLIPAKFSVAVLFVVACFVSTAMGDSDGSIYFSTDWRYYRDQCISRTFDRYFLWNCNYACDRTDKFCGFDQQHGIWNFRNV